MTAIRQGRVRVQAAHSAARSRRQVVWAEPPGRPTLARSRTHTTAPCAPHAAGARPPAGPAPLLLRSRLAGVLAGRLALVGAVGGPLLGLDSSDGRPGPLPVGPLGSVGRVRAEGPPRAGDGVGVPVVRDLGGVTSA